MHKLILQWNILFIISFICFVILAGEWGVDKSISYVKGRYNTIATYKCSFIDWTISDNSKTAIKLKCSNGLNIITDDATVVTTYLLNPGPINCTVYSSGDPYCDPRLKK